MYFKLTTNLLIILNFIFLVNSIADDGQWKKEDLPQADDAMDEDEPLISVKNGDRTKKSLDINSTIDILVDDKKLTDLKDSENSRKQEDIKHNDTMGRSYSLDEIVNAKDETKEGRIMNADDEGMLEKPKMNIQGFIPIVGLASAAIGTTAAANSASQNRQHLFSSNNMFGDSFSNIQSIPNFMLNQNQFNPANLMNLQNQYQQTRFNGPRNERRFTSTLQNLATSLTGSMNKLTKRKQLVDYSSFAQECICVPFYMCKTGFIEQTVKNQAGVGQTFQMSQYNQYRDQSLYEKQLQDAQAELNRHYTPQQITELLASLGQPDYSQSIMTKNEKLLESQRNYATLHSNSQSNQDSDLELPINERSIDAKENVFASESQNNTDIQALSRMFGLINAFSNKNDQNDGQSCGMLRTCCPLLSSKDILLAHQTLKGQQEPHGYDYNIFRQHTPSRKIAPIPNYSSFPMMSQKISRQSPYPMLMPTISQGMQSANHHDHVNFNSRLMNQKSLDRNLYSLYNTYNSVNNFQSKPTYTTHLNQFAQPIYSGKCGIKPTHFNQARIQNLHYPASSTEFGEFPWQAALLKRLGPQDSLFVCGGTLISDQWVLSAAHCIKKNTALDLKVRLGEYDVHRDDEFYPYVEREVSHIIKHPNFYPGTLENDIVLLRLETPISLASNPHIMPVCLPHYGENFAGRKCWTTGWGKSAFGHVGEYQSVLKKVDLPVIGHSSCNSILKRTKLGSNYDLHAGFMCAGGERGKDSCEGDGGSALVCDINGVWKAAGLVSWGIGCGKQGLPGVYVNTGFYENWIREVINGFEKSIPMNENEETENYSKSGRVITDNITTGISMNANSNEMSDNNDGNDNFLIDPASVINERSNSQFINGTESDELTLPLSITESSKPLYNLTIKAN